MNDTSIQLAISNLSLSIIVGPFATWKTNQPTVNLAKLTNQRDDSYKDRDRERRRKLFRKDAKNTDTKKRQRRPQATHKPTNKQKNGKTSGRPSHKRGTNKKVLKYMQRKFFPFPLPVGYPRKEKVKKKEKKTFFLPFSFGSDPRWRPKERRKGWSRSRRTPSPAS